MWRRRTKPVEGEKEDGPMKQIAESAVSAHRDPLYCIYEVRWEGQESRLAYHRSGSGTASGEWVSHMHDLVTGEEFDLSSDDSYVEARRVQTKMLPAPILEMWPTDENGKLFPQGYRDGKDMAGPEFFEQVVEKLKQPEDCKECHGLGVLLVKMPEVGRLQMDDRKIECPACAPLRRLQGKTVKV